MTHKKQDEDLKHQVMATVALALSPYTFDFRQEKRDKFLDEVAADLLSLITERDKKRDAYIIGEDEPQLTDDDDIAAMPKLAREHEESEREYKETRNGLRAEQRKRSEEVI